MMHTWLLVPVILSYVSPLLAFEMICEPNFLQMPVASSVSLRCFWKCESKCTTERIIWTKDNHILQEYSPLENQNNPTVDDRFQFIYQNIENGKVSMIIENLQLSDEGTFECMVIISGAYREGIINLQVSDLVNPDEKQETNFRPSEFVVPVAAAGLVFVIIVVIVLWMIKSGRSYCQKKQKLTYTGDVEEFNCSSGSDFFWLELITKSLKYNTEKSVKMALTPPPFRSRSQARRNEEGWYQERYPTINVLPEPIKHQTHIEVGKDEEEELRS